MTRQAQGRGTAGQFETFREARKRETYERRVVRVRLGELHVSRRRRGSREGKKDGRGEARHRNGRDGKCMFVMTEGRG
jgi:hypothetical protein